MQKFQATNIRRDTRLFISQAILKHSFMLYRQDATSKDIELEHIDHCMEYLRQVRLQYSDMSLSSTSLAAN